MFEEQTETVDFNIVPSIPAHLPPQSILTITYSHTYGIRFIDCDTQQLRLCTCAITVHSQQAKQKPYGFAWTQWYWLLQQEFKANNLQLAWFDKLC
jgi:hypothetical protein